MIQVEQSKGNSGAVNLVSDFDRIADHDVRNIASSVKCLFKGFAESSLYRAVILQGLEVTLTGDLLRLQITPGTAFTSVSPYPFILNAPRSVEIEGIGRRLVLLRFGYQEIEKEYRLFKDQESAEEYEDEAFTKKRLALSVMFLENYQQINISSDLVLGELDENNRLTERSADYPLYRFSQTFDEADKTLAQASWEALSNTLARRDGNGRMKTNDPAEGEHCVNLQTLNSAMALEEQSRLEGDGSTLQNAKNYTDSRNVDVTEELCFLSNTKVDKINGKGLSANDFTNALLNKLNGVAEGATNYAHPDTHPASMIEQTSNARFVTDSQIASWNSKASGSHTHSFLTTLQEFFEYDYRSGELYFHIYGESRKWFIKI